MSDRDPAIARSLDLLVPAPVSRIDGWCRVLADAAPVRRARPRLPGGRYRLLVVAIAAVVAIAIALPALGVVHEWFLDEHSPQPIGPIVTVATGVSDGAPWTLRAYVSAADGLCLVIDESDGQQGAEGCGGGVRGEPVTSYPKDQAPDRWVGFLSGGLSDTTERLVVGPVAAGVSAVDVRLASGADIAATIAPAPKELGLRLGFYTVTHPATDELTAIVALASDGKVLQELRLPPGFR